MINSGSVDASKFSHFFKAKPGQELNLLVLDDGFFIPAEKSMGQHLFVLCLDDQIETEKIDIREFDGVIIAPSARFWSKAITNLISGKIPVLFLDDSLEPEYLMQSVQMSVNHQSKEG